MANIEMLHAAKSNEGCLVKAQHICEGARDLVEEMEKFLNDLRGVDHSQLDAMPREKLGKGLESNLDATGRYLNRIEEIFANIKVIF